MHQDGSLPDPPTFPERNIPASTRLSQLLNLVPDIPDGTALSELQAKDAVKDYISKLEKIIAMKPRRLCRCCGEPEERWLQNDDLAHLYIGSDVCQACEAMISWAENLPAKLELVAAYLRLLKKEQETRL